MNTFKHFSVFSLCAFFFNFSNRYEEPTSSMALTQVREPPDVAKSNTEAHTGEQILGFVVPFGPVLTLNLLHQLQVLVREDPVFELRV